MVVRHSRWPSVVAVWVMDGCDKGGGGGGGGGARYGRSGGGRSGRLGKEENAIEKY